MNKQSGFTLVELMAVIVVLGLLMAIVVPNSLKISSKVKDNAYNTKISLIESAAKDYGQSNVTYIKRGLSFADNRNYTCRLYFDDNEKLSEVKYNLQSSYEENKTLSENEFWCSRVKIEDLVNSESLMWDEKNRCNNSCTEEEKKNYDNVILDTINSNIINKCYVYIYYKYNRIYAVFDSPTCKIVTDTITDGHEYKQINLNRQTSQAQ